MSIKEVIADIRRMGATRQDSLGVLAELQGHIEKLQGERGRLTMAPAARADVEAMLKNWVEASAAAFRKEMAARVEPFARDARALDNQRLIEHRITLAGSDDAPGAGLDRALCAAIPDRLLAAMVDSLSLIEWSAKSVPLAVRNKRLAELDQLEAAAHAREAELVAAIEEAGIRL